MATVKQVMKGAEDKSAIRKSGKCRGGNKRRNWEIVADCTQRQHEFFAEEAERILGGEMLRKPRSSMRRKSLLKISN